MARHFISYEIENQLKNDAHLLFIGVQLLPQMAANRDDVDGKCTKIATSMNLLSKNGI